jgi:hypothetical protein
MTVRESSTMRCQDVTRQLATARFTATTPSSDLSAHVASCPSCAAFANEGSRLGAIWAETRLDEPTSARLDALWAEVSRGIAAESARSGRISAGSANRRRWVVGLVLAQAALVLVAGLVAFPRFRPEPVAQPVVVVHQPRKEAALPTVVVEQGQSATFAIGADNRATVVLNEQSSVDRGTVLATNTPFDVFSGAEGMVK